MLTPYSQYVIIFSKHSLTFKSLCLLPKTFSSYSVFSLHFQLFFKTFQSVGNNVWHHPKNIYNSVCNRFGIPYKFFDSFLKNVGFLLKTCISLV